MAENTELSQYVAGFRANLNMAPQQTDTRLLSCVDSDLHYGEPGTGFNADNVAPTDPEETTTRVPDTPDKFLDKSRRVGFFATLQDSAWLDNVDKAAELTDPTNSTMSSLMAGRWRAVDSKIIQGGLGVAYDKPDENGAPTVVGFPASQVILANDVSMAHQNEVVPSDSSDYGLSVGKLIAANLLLDDSDLEGDRYLTLGPRQVADLLRRTPVTSEDYAEVKALASGKIDSILGFKVIRLPRKRLLTLAAAPTTRRLMAWIKPAIVYRGRPITEASIRIRTDKSDTPQAFYKTQHGAVRRYDAGVVEIQAKET